MSLKKRSLSGTPLISILVLSVIILLAITFRSVAAADNYGDTTTPIKHVVVIFQENVSFGHYFGTYPKTITDSNGHVIFRPKDDSPRVNGLTEDLLTKNQNSA